MPRNPALTTQQERVARQTPARRNVTNADRPAAASTGVPSYGIADDFPLLWKMAQHFDFTERLGGCTDPLLAESDAALRECWEARRSYIEDGGPL